MIKRNNFTFILVFALLMLTSSCAESNNKEIKIKGDAKMTETWKKEPIKSALTRYLPILTKGMNNEEKEIAEKAYRILLPFDYTDKEPRAIDDRVFEELLQDRINKAMKLPIEERRQILHQDIFKSEFEPLNKFAENTAIDVLNGKAVSPELRVKTEDVLKKLEQMRVRLENEFPELNESVGHFISESLVDCDYILHEGKGQKMSLRLSHIYRRMHSKE